jgi:hypothetical protein
MFDLLINIILNACTFKVAHDLCIALGVNTPARERRWMNGTREG